MKFLKEIPKFLINIPVYFYKWFISPLFPRACRYTPTCSTYFIQAVKEYGAIKGGIMGAKRILRCTPNSKGGFDPVPLNIKGDKKWIL